MINNKTQIDATTYEVEFSVDAQQLQTEKKRLYRANVARYNVPGFRKGKAPMNVIERMYGPVFTQEAVENLYNKNVDLVVTEFGEEVVDVNSAEVVSLEGDVVYKAKFITKPEVKIEGYKGLTVEKAEPVVTDEDVESELKNIQQRNSRTIDVDDRPAQMDDTVVFDFEGFCGGEAFDGGKAENYSLKLGSGQFIPGFEEGMVGHSIGEEFDVNVTFPEEYHAEELAGQPAVFKVTIHQIKMTELPELDDEFAKDVSEFDTLAEYKEDIRADLLRTAEEKAKDDADNKLMDALIDLLDADIPEVMYDKKVDENVRDFSYRLQSNGMNLDDYFTYTGLDMESFRGQFREQAIRQVKLRLALEKIAELEAVAVSDEDVETEYANLAKNYDIPVDQVKTIVPVEGLRLDVAVEKAVDVVRDSANYVAPSAE
ncbi:MAG: trigger factor [Clostridia bacterium]|nr:trigger factor [Clostridia bacterium]